MGVIDCLVKVPRRSKSPWFTGVAVNEHHCGKKRHGIVQGSADSYNSFDHKPSNIAKGCRVDPVDPADHKQTIQVDLP